VTVGGLALVAFSDYVTLTTYLTTTGGSLKRSEPHPAIPVAPTHAGKRVPCSGSIRRPWQSPETVETPDSGILLVGERCAFLGGRLWPAGAVVCPGVVRERFFACGIREGRGPALVTLGAGATLASALRALDLQRHADGGSDVPNMPGDIFS
jgi:hypothetical protein